MITEMSMRDAPRDVLRVPDNVMGADLAFPGELRYVDASGQPIDPSRMSAIVLPPWARGRITAVGMNDQGQTGSIDIEITAGKVFVTFGQEMQA
jgi:hypothetical protein